MYDGFKGMIESMAVFGLFFVLWVICATIGITLTVNGHITLTIGTLIVIGSGVLLILLTIFCLWVIEKYKGFL